MLLLWWDTCLFVTESQACSYLFLSLCLDLWRAVDLHVRLSENWLWTVGATSSFLVFHGIFKQVWVFRQWFGRWSWFNIIINHFSWRLLGLGEFGEETIWKPIERILMFLCSVSGLWMVVHRWHSKISISCRLSKPHTSKNGLCFLALQILVFVISDFIRRQSALVGYVFQ